MERYNPLPFLTLGKSLGAISSLTVKSSELDVRTVTLDLLSEIYRFDNSADAGIVFSEVTLIEAKNIREALTFPLTDWSEYSYPQRRETLRAVNEYVRRFINFLEADCSNYNLYSVHRILAYDTDTLIRKGFEMIPLRLRSLFPPDRVEDIESATRCVAFSLPTAAAFHLGRAFEGAVRDLNTQINGKPPKKINLRTMIINLEHSGIRRSLWLSLDDIRANYRNPVSHPGRHVSLAEIQPMLGVYITAMIGIYEHLLSIQPPSPATIIQTTAKP